MDNLVQILYDNGNLVCILKLDEDISRHELNITIDDIKKSDFFVACWLLSKLTPLFKLMPFEFNFACPKELFDDISGSLNYCNNILHNTNELIKSKESYLDVAKDNHNILYINVSEDLRYKSFYEILKDNDKIKTHYLNMDLGFNRKTREWEERPEPISISDLFQFIIDNKIKKIVSINEYFLNYYTMTYHINLATVLNKMGVEFITIDNDPADLSPEGHYRRVIGCSDSGKRFSNLKCLNKDFDNLLGLEGVTYNAIPQDYRKSDIKRLESDYDIVVLTNSRYHNVENLMSSINNLLKILPADTIFDDIVNWYMAMRAIILSGTNFSEVNQMHMNSSLHGFFYTLVNWFKYKIIENIETDRKFHVYGDVGFKKICPELYRGSLDNKGINELFEGNNLYLLMNFSYTYLDASGPLYDMIRRGVPWLNVVTPIKSNSLKGLELLEYNNDVEGLNNKINNAHELYNNPHLLKALDDYRLILKSSVDEMKSYIIGTKNSNDLLFQKELDEHQIIMDQTVEKYIQNNEDLLRSSFKILFVI